MHASSARLQVWQCCSPAAHPCPPPPSSPSSPACHSAIFRDFDPAFEAGSLDEAHLDVTDYCAAQGVTPEEAAAQIRGRVQHETRLTCSGGRAGVPGEGGGWEWGFAAAAQMQSAGATPPLPLAVSSLQACPSASACPLTCCPCLPLPQWASPPTACWPRSAATSTSQMVRLGYCSFVSWQVCV